MKVLNNWSSNYTINIDHTTTTYKFVNIAYIAGKSVQVQALHITKLRVYVEMPHSPKIKGRDQILIKLQGLWPPRHRYMTFFLVFLNVW